MNKKLEMDNELVDSNKKNNVDDLNKRDGLKMNKNQVRNISKDNDNKNGKIQ